MTVWPDKNFYALEELHLEWQVSFATIKTWLMAGDLTAHLWVPVMSVFAIRQVSDGGAIKIAHELHHYEGYVPLSQYHCQRLFRSGQLTLRDFASPCGQDRYQLPETADDIRAQSHDLVILTDERKRFEIEHGMLSKLKPEACEITLDDDFRSVTTNGQTHYFGDMQSTILRNLYQAAMDGEPWQSGKQLLYDAGSESFKLSSLFKHKPIWRELIESDGMGRYRLKEVVIS